MSVTAGPDEAAVVKTLLVTDLVDSTSLLAALGDRRGADIFARADRLARDLVARFGGREIDRADGFLILFDRPIDATRCALAFHSGLAALSAETGVALGARAGIHLGEVYIRENTQDDVARGAKAVEVDGLAKATAARIASLAIARQTLLTPTAFDLVRRAAVGGDLLENNSDSLQWLAHGAYRFKGVDDPIDVYEVGIVGLAPLSVPPDTDKAKRAVSAAEEEMLGWRPAPGQEIPRRPHWRLDEKLGEGGFGEAWVATHRQTGERRVFKFCFEAERLRGLRREVTLFRLIRETLGDQENIARIIDWQFDEPPFFLESEYTAGGNLADWAAAQGGLANIPLATRLDLIAQTADAIAVAHSVGILHKDIKPANVLVAPDRDGTPRVRLMDFGIGLIDDTHELMARGITNLGFTQMSRDVSTSGSGTFIYMAPEIVEGRRPTIQADLYSLGVMLYQASVGDFGRALTSSWQRDVDDELLREEIAALVDGAPERRPASALIVAEHLRTLEARRAERAAEAAQRAQAEADRAALARANARRRQFGIAAAVATIVLIVVSALAVQTVRARREAELRRGQAEDLFGFLLGDLRAKLRPVGRLDVLDDVGERARAHFEAIPPSMRTDADLVRHAQTLSQIGQVRVDQGKLPEALPIFEQALTLMRDVVARNPGNGEWRFELGQSQYWVGLVKRRQGDNAGALVDWQAYLETSQHLYAQDPSRPEWRAEVGYAYGNVGLIMEAEGDLDGALDAYRQSLSIKEAIADARPGEAGPQADLAVSHNKMAFVLEKKGDLQGALEAFDRERAIREALVERDPRNTNWQWRLAVSHNMVGTLYLALGQIDAADDEIRQQHAIMRRLTEQDPDNFSWRRQLALADLNVGRLEAERGNVALAERHFRASLGVMAAAVARDPDNLAWQHEAARAHRHVGEMRLAQGDVTTALAEGRAARDVFERLLDSRDADERTSHELASALILLGQALDRSGASREAIQAWEQAVAICGRHADSSFYGLIDTWASGLIYLGRLEQAVPLLRRLDAMGYRSRDLTRLRTLHHLEES